MSVVKIVILYLNELSLAIYIVKHSTKIILFRATKMAIAEIAAAINTIPSRNSRAYIARHLIVGW
jgi:hypothetical protein